MNRQQRTALTIFSVLIIIVFVLIVFTGFGGLNPGTASNINTPNQNVPGYTPNAPLSGGSQPMTGGMTIGVTISNFTFMPPNLTIPRGTTVVWTNQDSVEHSVVSGSYQSAPIAPGQSLSARFDSPGVFDYHCGIHPNMTGMITVQ